MHSRSFRIKHAVLVTSTILLVALSAFTLKLSRRTSSSSRKSDSRQVDLVRPSKFKNYKHLSELRECGNYSLSECMERKRELMKILARARNLTTKPKSLYSKDGRLFTGPMVESCYGISSCYFEVDPGEPILTIETLFRRATLSSFSVVGEGMLFSIFRNTSSFGGASVYPDAGVMYASIPIVENFIFHRTSAGKIGIFLDCGIARDTLCSSIQDAKPF